MLAISEQGDLLKVVSTGDCDFSAAREMLLACNDHLLSSHINRIEVVFEEMTIFNTCSIGTLLLLSDAVMGRLQIRLQHCSPFIHQLFESETIQKHFGRLRAIPAPTMQPACASCFEKNCQLPGAGCATGIAAS